MAYNASLYMHDLDKRAFDALNMFPQFIKLQEAYITNVDERAAKIKFLSNAIRLSDKQMPEIYALLPPICEKLGIVVPDLYMVQSKYKKDLNAFTGGITSPFVCVTTELIKQMPVELVGSIIAHECGHIACKHYLYHSLAANFANGIESSPLAKIPAIRKHISKALVTALLLWDRCSELSADRAAVLCDEDAGKTIDALLRVHGFDQNIDRDEFIKQALDLKDFINGSETNKIMEQMLVQWNSHPLLATRAYECHDWAQTERFKGILSGTATEEKAAEDEAHKEETEVLAAEIAASGESMKDAPPEVVEALNKRLQELDGEIERYTNHADKSDYALAVASGIISALLDSFFVGAFSLLDAHEWGSEKTEQFVLKVARHQGYRGSNTKGAIVYLAENAPHNDKSIKPGYHLASDTNTNDFGGSYHHHLRDFAHHATITGLLFSILTQFTEKCYGTNTKGEFIVVDVGNKSFIGKDTPQKLMFGAVFWFFHLVSDVAGSGKQNSEGTGIPGAILSVAKLLSATPLFKNQLNEKDNREFSVFISKLFNGTFFGEKDEKGKLIPLRFDFRTELGIAHHLSKQVFPVLLNEACVRTFYMLRTFSTELISKQIKSFEEANKLNWQRIKPVANRTVDRMIAVATITFNAVDTLDAAGQAAFYAIESGGNWVIFSGRFVARYNYVGAGRAALAIVKEFSNEKKEAQLIHERMLLMNAKAQMMFGQLQDFKEKLNEKLSEYLAEDIEAFMEGFDNINEGLRSNNSNLVIKGNVTIQRVLGREPQFNTQKEFDDLMESDIPLQL